MANASRRLGEEENLMFSKICKHFTLANVLLTLALVFAMTGGAYAANKYLITSTKQISPKVLKALAGKPGAKGSAGPAGPAGLAGATGKEGPAGKEGPTGKNGSNGENVSAKEVKTSEITCSKQGGSSFTTGSTTTLACNGKEGKQGEPWTAGGILPKGKTEQGVWVTPIATSPVGEGKLKVGNGAISFVIPLTGAPTVEFVKEGEAGKEHTAECPGTPEEPKATEGFLCVYTAGGGSGAAEFEEAISYPSGVLLRFTNGAAAGLNANGTWAVTAG
jgi:hypothetical protein